MRPNNKLVGRLMVMMFLYRPSPKARANPPLTKRAPMTSIEFIRYFATTIPTFMSVNKLGHWMGNEVRSLFNKPKISAISSVRRDQLTRLTTFIFTLTDPPLSSQIEQIDKVIGEVESALKKEKNFLGSRLEKMLTVLKIDLQMVREQVKPIPVVDQSAIVPKEEPVSDDLHFKGQTAAKLTQLPSQKIPDVSSGVDNPSDHSTTLHNK